MFVRNNIVFAHKCVITTTISIKMIFCNDTNQKPRKPIGESWGMANDGEWRTGQYLVEGVKVIKCFHPRMLTPPMARVNTN